MAAATHQRWFDNEQRYVYGTDELDAGNSDPKTRTLVCSCEDLDDSKFVKFSTTTLTRSTTTATCTMGTWMCQANYCAGALILKIYQTMNSSQATYFACHQAGISGRINCLGAQGFRRVPVQRAHSPHADDVDQSFREVSGIPVTSSSPRTCIIAWQASPEGSIATFGQ